MAEVDELGFRPKEDLGFKPKDDIGFKPAAITPSGMVRGSNGMLLGGSTPPEPGFTQLVKEEMATPFVELSKPAVETDDTSLTRFGKGLAQSGIGAAEGLETPMGVSLLAASALPGVGKAIGRTAAAGFGVKSTLEGFKEAAQAYQTGDMEKAGRALGNLILGGAMVRGSVAMPGAKVAPRTAEALKQAGEILPEASKALATVEETAAADPPSLAQIPGLKPGEMPAPPEQITIKGTLKGMSSDDISKAVMESISEGGMAQGIKEGGDKSGHYVVAPADPSIEGDMPMAVGPFVSKEAAAEFLDSEVGAPGASVIEARFNRPSTETTVPSKQLMAETAPPEPPRAFAIPGIAKLTELRRGLAERMRQKPERQEIAATYDAISNEANIAGRQTENKVKLALPDELDRQAMTAVVQAPDLSKMTGDAVKVEASSAPEALKAIYRHAVANYDRLRKLAPEIDAIHSDQLAAERASGIDVDSIDNYVAQRWDFDTMLGANKPVILDATGGKGGASTFFKKQRVFEDYATGIAAGYVPKSMDVAALAAHRVRAGQQLINQRTWAQSLRNVENPIDSKPVATDLIKQPKGTLVPPPGYEYANLFNQPVALHESFAPLARALTGPSLVPKLASQAPAFVKHGLLFFDTFHGSRLAQMGTAAKGSPSYRSGLSILEYSKEDLKAAVAANEITPEMAAYADLHRPTLEAGVAAGLNVARISDALYKDVVAKVPVVGGYTKWLFDKFQRGLMSETYINWRARNERIYPDETAKELDFRTAREVNTFYRSLGSQGTFKSKTWQDMARIVALAPQWVEGGLKSEAAAYAQTARVPIDVATGNTRIGNLSKTAGTGLLAYVAVTQIINLASTGHPTWENPEGHKMDAYIPDWLSESEGYWFSPLSVFAELTHDFLKYDEQENSALGVVAHIAGNKLQPVMRAGKDLLQGKDYFDRPLPTTLDRIEQAGYDLLPVPIPLSSLYAQRPGQAQQTILSSVGLKVDKVKSEKSEIGLRNALIEEQLQFLVSKARLKPVDQRLDYILEERDKRIKEEDVPIFNRKLQELLRKKVIQRE